MEMLGKGGEEAVAVLLCNGPGSTEGRRGLGSEWTWLV